MANTVKLKRSSVPDKIPLTTDVELGELAMNTNDGKLFMKKDDGSESIVEVAVQGNIVLDGGSSERLATGNTLDILSSLSQTWKFTDVALYYSSAFFIDNGSNKVVSFTVSRTNISFNRSSTYSLTLNSDRILRVQESDRNFAVFGTGFVYANGTESLYPNGKNLPSYGADYSNNVMYVVGASIGVVAYDVTDLNVVNEISTYSNISNNDITISGNYAYLLGTDKTLKVLDISDPSSMVLKSTLPFIDQTYAGDKIQVDGNTAYVLVRKDNSDSKLISFDISDPLNVVEKASYSYASITDFVIHNSGLIILASTYRFISLDISDRNAITLIKNQYIGSMPYNIIDRLDDYTCYGSYNNKIYTLDVT